MLSRPWYDRLWVKQEVWAARQITAVCGKHRIKMTRLEDFAKIFANLRKDVRNPFEKFSTSSDPVPEKGKLIVDNLAAVLLGVLQRTSSSKCADLRDYVFGVLGMVGPSDEIICNPPWSD